MRIDLPRCNFKSCHYQNDGNCVSKSEYKRCDYIAAVKTLETIMGSQKYCILCDNVACLNSSTSEASCSPKMEWNQALLGEYMFIYETGVETLDVLGSSNQFFNVITTTDEREAFEAYYKGGRNYLRKHRYGENYDTWKWDPETLAWRR